MVPGADTRPTADSVSRVRFDAVLAESAVVAAFEESFRPQPGHTLDLAALGRSNPM